MTQIDWVLFQDKDTAQAVRDIMGRTQTVEMDWGTKGGKVGRGSWRRVMPLGGTSPRTRALSPRSLFDGA